MPHGSKYTYNKWPSPQNCGYWQYWRYTRISGIRMVPVDIIPLCYRILYFTWIITRKIPWALQKCWIQDEHVDTQTEWWNCIQDNIAHSHYSELASETEKTNRVAGGHTKKLTAESTYEGFVSRESVCIAFNLAALNYLDIFAADIKNSYLTAPCGEKIIFTCGPESRSEHKGKTAVVVWALYGLRSIGSAFSNNLDSCMEALNFVPCRSDPDAWMRKARESNGTEYYEYMLLYVDGFLAISETPKEAVLQLDKFIKMMYG